MAQYTVVHFITSLESGGAQRALYTLLRADTAGPYTHVVWYLHDGPYRERFCQLGVSVSRVVGSFGVYDPTIVWRLYRMIMAMQPAVLHTSLWFAGFLGRLVGPYAGVPVLCDLHSDVRYHGKIRGFFDRITASRARYCAVSSALKHSFSGLYFQSPR